MATNYERIYINKEEEESSIGHCARFTFSVDNFDTIPAWQFQQIYDTHCNTLPTSWRIIIKSQKDSVNSCYVTLSRSEGAYRPVDVFLRISCFDIHHQRLSHPKVFDIKDIFPAGEVQGCIDNMVPREKLRILAGHGLIIQVYLFISSCHQKNVHSVEDLNSDFSELQLSKM